MRPLVAMMKGSLTFGGTGGTFNEGPFWSRPDLRLTSYPSNQEAVEDNFAGYVRHALKANGVVFACVLARQMTFSEVRFQYQRLNNGKPGDLFGNPSLSLLENPWPNGTTGELLSRMEQDASLAGNFYATTAGMGDERRIRRLRPDWVTIVTGSPSDDPFDVDAKVIGYMYQPQDGKPRPPRLLTPDQVVHYSPIPDPDAQWRGMSWITPVVGEIMGHSAASKHKLKFFQNGTTSGTVVSYDKTLTRAQFLEYVAAYREAHEGVDNAYKTIHMGGGADVKALGANLQQLDFKATQGAAETLIAAASGAGAIIAQLSEGLQGSALNQGNFGAARRRFADMVIRPLWRTAAASLSKFSEPPAGTRLWFDASDVAFLQEDAKDAADIEQVKATTIKSLVEAGFDPASCVAAVQAQDMNLLTHTGMTSVQLMAPGTGAPPAA